MPEVPVMLTIKQASKEIEGLKEYRIRQMCKNGEIPCVMAGNKYLVNRNVLYSYLNGDLFVPKENKDNELKSSGISPIKL